MFVIINLQTWVLLLDFLGIGIPTPPPSRPDTPTEERPFTKQDSSPPRRKNPVEEINSRSSERSKGRIIDDSLLQDARDMLSLGADLDPENTLYMSAHPTPSSAHFQARQETTPTRYDHDEGGVAIPKARVLSDLSNVQEAYSNSVLTSPDGESKDAGTSVWGTEGKLSAEVKLNVNSLTVTFNKPEHPLARGSVRGVAAQVKLTRGNMEISGFLGQGSVLDMTETGTYYRERLGSAQRT